MQTFLKFRRYVVISGLACLSAGRAVAVIYSKEVVVLSEVFEHTTSILALLLFGPTAHKRGHIHLNPLKTESLVLKLVMSFTLFLLLIALTCSKDAQKVHGSSN
jgi:hypothetical protein